MTPIRKGSNPVKIPFAIKSSDPTFAAWANETRTAIRQLEARMPTANVGQGPAGGGSKPPFWTTISRVPDSDPAEYQVAVTLGYLSYQSNTPAAQASDLGTTGWIVPTIAGVSMEPPIPQTDPPTEIPKLPLPDVESWVYLRVKTDSDGFPKDGEVTVEAFDEAQESIHHIRLSPESDEEEGDYFFLILKTKADESDPPRPIPERRITGNREMPNQLIEILNLGEESEAGRQEVYKGYDVALDKHDVRAVLQQQTPGVAIIEPLAAAVPEVPPVTDAEGTVVTPGSPAIPAEEPGDYIRWRSVDGRASYSESSNPNTSRQIEVREREEDNEDLPGQKKQVIEVVGNDYTESLTSVKKFSIEINDGLVSSFLKEDSDAEGWWGTVTWVWQPASASGPSEYTYLILTFAAGILTLVQNGLGPAPAVNPGVEGAPGGEVFTIQQ
jgi:hypothetical protein